jgi:hypothetical protein
MNPLNKFQEILKTRRQRLARKEALEAGKFYWAAILSFHKEAIVLTTLLTEKFPNVRRLCLNFLAERALQGALHANFLYQEYPYSSHADLAGINRGIIEASDNYFYLFDDPTCDRTAAFWARSGFEESIRNEGLKRWIESDNSLIRNMARSDYEPKLMPFEEMLRGVSQMTGVERPDRNAWPNFKERCNAVGEIWTFIYDMEYKALSTWQHGDLSRIIISPAFARLQPVQEKRNVFESFVMLQWAFTLNYLFVHELAIRNKEPERINALDHTFYSALDRAGTIMREYVKQYQPDKMIRNQES